MEIMADDWVAAMMSLYYIHHSHMIADSRYKFFTYKVVFILKLVINSWNVGFLRGKFPSNVQARKSLLNIVSFLQTWCVPLRVIFEH